MSTAIEAAATLDSTLARARLGQLEATIERGLNTFIEVGASLLEIREARLYRADFSTFEDYCQKRWSMTSRRAVQLMSAAEAVAEIGTIVPILPVTESQARPLTRLAPEQQRQAWDRALELSPKPTAAVVEEAVREIEGKPRLAVHFSSASDDWATPNALFQLLASEFPFETDVCATPENAKCAQFYSRKHDGLAQKWTGVCWMNPPYGDGIDAWVEKARISASENGATVVCLVPARVDTNWWWDNCRYGEVRFLRGRLKFGGCENSAPFPSAVVIFGRKACVKWWESWPRV